VIKSFAAHTAATHINVVEMCVIAVMSI